MKGLLLIALGAAVILQTGASSREAQLSILKMAGGTAVNDLSHLAHKPGHVLMTSSNSCSMVLAWKMILTRHARFNFPGTKNAFLRFSCLCIHAFVPALTFSTDDETEQYHASRSAKSHEEVIRNLQKDAENQKRIMASKRSADDDDIGAQSMSPHLVMHATRGQDAGKRRGGDGGRGREHKSTQKSIHGTLSLPPDEATPFFDTYVLKYAFPTIAIICRSVCVCTLVVIKSVRDAYMIAKFHTQSVGMRLQTRDLT
jgi:hypothetical protein